MVMMWAKLLYQNQDSAAQLVDNLWNGKTCSFELLSKDKLEQFAKNLKIDQESTEEVDAQTKQKLERQKKEQVKNFWSKKSKILLHSNERLKRLKKKLEEASFIYAILLCLEMSKTIPSERRF